MSAPFTPEQEERIRAIALDEQSRLTARVAEGAELQTALREWEPQIAEIALPNAREKALAFAFRHLRFADIRGYALAAKYFADFVDTGQVAEMPDGTDFDRDAW